MTRRNCYLFYLSLVGGEDYLNPPQNQLPLTHLIGTCPFLIRFSSKNSERLRLFHPLPTCFNLNSPKPQNTQYFPLTRFIISLYFRLDPSSVWSTTILLLESPPQLYKRQVSTFSFNVVVVWRSLSAISHRKPSPPCPQFHRTTTLPLQWDLYLAPSGAPRRHIALSLSTRLCDSPSRCCGTRHDPFGTGTMEG